MRGLVDFKVILFGESKLCEFYNLFFTKNEVQSILYSQARPEDLRGVSFGVLFPKDDIHSTEDSIKEIKQKFGESFKILPIFEKKNYYTLDAMFLAGIERICFEFKPENVLKELVDYYEAYVEKNNNVKVSDNYVINFYENKGIFLIDISGELKKEKLLPLKLMFTNYLLNKLPKLKGILYIFNNTDEKTVNFVNIWALFRFWKSINFDYNKIMYLTASNTINDKLIKYIGHLGVKHSSNLLDVVKNLYPEFSNKSEIQIFDFASDILQTDARRTLS
ncbi:MAG TPA: hypothetical protein PLO89_03520 [Spirochaetota bacterium]|nr:hypothetical protein [Spirochaetota bacterium]